MTENQPQSSLVQERQKNISLITAGIFILLGLTFFIYEIYSIIGPQKGHFDFSDPILLPMGALMFLVAIASLLLISARSSCPWNRFAFLFLCYCSADRRHPTGSGCSLDSIFVHCRARSDHDRMVNAQGFQTIGDPVHRDCDYSERGDRIMEPQLPRRFLF